MTDTRTPDQIPTRKPLTSEHKEKLVAYRTGKTHSQETKDKMKLAKKLNPSPGHTGHKHTPETLAKIKATKAAKRLLK